MFCKFCGTEIDDNAVFCPECGKNLKKTETLDKKDELGKSQPKTNNRGFILCTVASFLIIAAGAISAYALDQKMNSPWVSDNTFNLNIYKHEEQKLVDLEGKNVSVNCYKIPEKQLRLFEDKKLRNVVCGKDVFIITHEKNALDVSYEAVNNLMVNRGYNVVVTTDIKKDNNLGKYVLIYIENRVMRSFAF